jgi:histidinol-phosphate aminotransferase
MTPRRASRIPEAGAGIPPAPPWIDLRLDGNQGRAPSPAFVASLPNAAELLRAYPLDRGLETALAERHAVAPERIFVGAGADEVLDRLCRTVLEAGREAIVPVPTFEMLERYVAMSGAAVVRVPWPEGPWPRERVLASITNSTALIAVVSPNNPTGLVATAADVRFVCEAAPHAVVLVDAAYAEFGGEDLTAAALALPNAVVVRTFSKAFGLAGLRVGYAIAPPDVARWLRAAGSPFTCGTWSRVVAAHRLARGITEVEGYVADVAREREELGEQARTLGLDPLPSAGNFVFLRGGDPEWLRDALGGLGIAVRAFPGGVRITLPADRDSFARLLGALRAAAAPEAMLLDLDGVLADIEGRRAIAAVDDVAALAQLRPIGVVTSCPRRLAESILQRHGFLAHVKALVGSEDGPGKPDAAPVHLALDRLGAKTGWMLGDNPVDVLAARAGGAVPLAAVPVGDGAGVHARRLRECGATRLVEGVGGLLALVRATLATR